MNERPCYYDRLGVPIDFYEWGRLMEDPDYRIIVCTPVNDVFVSTVWLGLDHNFLGGPHLIFETMVFAIKLTEGEFFGRRFDYHKALDEMTMRYSTEAQAREGHEEVVRLLQEVEESLDATKQGKETNGKE